MHMLLTVVFYKMLFFRLKGQTTYAFWLRR